MTTDVFARYGALDPAGTADAAPDWDAVDSVLLATIDERAATVSTQLDHSPTNEPATRRSSRGLWMAAAAFAAVIIAGVAVLAAMTGTGEPPTDEIIVPQVESVPAPPFDNATDASIALDHALANGTAEDIHALLAPEFGSNSFVGPTVAETDERLRFDRGIGTTTVHGPCTDNAPTSSTCELAISNQVIEMLIGREFAYRTVTVRIDDAGYITYMSEGVGVSEPPPFDLDQEFQDWVSQGNSAPFIEINPYVDSTGQLDIPPEQAAEEYLAILARFLTERSG